MSRVVKLDEVEMYHSECLRMMHNTEEAGELTDGMIETYAKMGLNEWRVNHG